MLLVKHLLLFVSELVVKSSTYQISVSANETLAGSRRVDLLRETAGDR